MAHCVQTGCRSGDLDVVVASVSTDRVSWWEVRTRRQLCQLYLGVGEKGWGKAQLEAVAHYSYIPINVASAGVLRVLVVCTVVRKCRRRRGGRVQRHRGRDLDGPRRGGVGASSGRQRRRPTGHRRVRLPEARAHSVVYQPGWQWGKGTLGTALSSASPLFHLPETDKLRMTWCGTNLSLCRVGTRLGGCRFRHAS